MNDLIKQLKEELDKLPVGSDLGDFGNIIGYIVGMNLKHPVNTGIGWEKDDFMYGIKHGFSLTDGTHDFVEMVHDSNEALREYGELQKQQKELDKEIERLSHLLKSQNIILITKNDDPKTYHDESEFRNIDNAPDNPRYK